MIEPFHVELTDMPMPPSANELYSTLPARAGKRFGRRCKSEAYNEYYRAMSFWALMHPNQVDAGRRLALSMEPGTCIAIKTMFKFNRSSIITKDNRPKRNDTSNRLKALYDIIGELLHIDDSYIWRGSFDKCVIQEFQPETCDVTIVQAVF